MNRWLIAGLLALGLAIGVWILWPQGEPTPSTTTLVAIGSTTTTSVPDSTTSTTGASSTTETSHVVSTVEEAEEILGALWFGWFEGIYNQDEARIREVVGSQTALDNAVAQFGVMEFSAAPSERAVQLNDVEILESNGDCLVVWAALDVSSFRSEAVGSEGVHVLRRQPPDWYLVSIWQNRNDLWNADCAAVFEPLP